MLKGTFCVHSCVNFLHQAQPISFIVIFMNYIVVNSCFVWTQNMEHRQKLLESIYCL